MPVKAHHPILYARELSGGDRGTAETLDAMRRVATRGAHAPAVIALARQIRARPHPLEALYAWAKDHVRFRRDPPGVEEVRLPRFMLEDIARQGYAEGDCDDLATLLASILLAAGFTPFLAVVGRRASGPYEHVFAGVLIGGRLYSLDPQEGVPIGQWPESGRRAVMVVQ